MSENMASSIKIGLAVARPNDALAELGKFIADTDCDLLIFPEGFLDSDEIDEAVEIVRRQLSWVLCGVDDHRPINQKQETAILFNNHGTIVGEHVKTSLTTAEIESCYGPGDSLEPLDTPWGKIGIAICYEIHFPEVARTLALKGARMIINPIGTGMWHERQFRQWNAIASARASENEVPVVGVSHYNYAIPLAFAYDEWGDCIVRCRDQNRLVVVDINLPDVTKKRKFDQRRPELYSIITQAKNQ